MFLEKGDVKAGDGIVIPQDLLPGRQMAPRPAQIHPELMAPRRRFLCKASRNQEFFIDSFQKRLFRKAVEIPDGTVVIHDSELILGKQDGHQEMIRLVPPIAGIPVLPKAGDRRRGGGPVMAVGDVEGFDQGEPFHDVRISAGSLMTQTVWTTPSSAVKSYSGGPASDPRRQTVDRLPPPVGEQDRPRLRPDGVDMTRPLLFLVGPRQFVPPDPPGFILGDTDAGHNPGL